MAPIITADTGSHAVKIGRDGSVYLGIGLVIVVALSAMEWRSVTTRLTTVELNQARVEKEAEQAATSEQVQRLENRLQNIEALLMERARERSP